jgi:hypothetical protein
VATLSSNELLAFRLLLTFVAMGTWVSVIAMATERWGGKLGGFLVGIPSTSAFSLFFTGLYVSPSAAVSATDSFPVFMSLTGVFLLCFGLTARKSFRAGLAASISVWFALSFLVVLINVNEFIISLVVSALISVAIYVGFRIWRTPVMRSRSKTRVSGSLLVLRFVFGGAVVTIAVFMSQIGIPILSGMFAAFPALTISTLIAIQMNGKTRGTEHARGIAFPIMVSIMLLCIPYSIAVHYLYPSLGLVTGTVIAFAMVIAIGIPYYLFVEERLVPSTG